MGKRISPTAIGAFVVASFAILVLVLVIAGSGKLFQKPIKFVCLFRGDLNGLKVGAPVKFRGVQIGAVSAIKLRLLPSEGQIKPDVKGFRLPVILELDPAMVAGRGGTGEAFGKAGFEEMLQRGLRAQLSVESLLTGLLYVDLDLRPHTKVDLVLVPGSSPYREIPTIPTTMEAFQEKATDALEQFGQIDFQKLAASITQAANSLTDAAGSIKKLANSPDLKATLAGLKEASRNLNQTLVSVRMAVNTAGSKVNPLIEHLQQNSDEMNLTLKETRAALVQLQATLDPDSPLAVHLNQALDQFSNTAQSIGDLTDYLRENPSSLIRGKYVPAQQQ
ncbi:MAG TPA: MlaD family protein [Candidatus Binataceae bacterium]|nr:MlaD family protein [Candidatus Binataceae bacterium]